MTKKLLEKIVTCFVASFTLLSSFSFTFADTNISFSDLPKTHWAYDKIMSMAEEGVINGYPDGQFRPDNYMTYGEFIKIVAKSFDEGKNLTNSENGHWAKEYYDFLLKNEVFSNEEITEAHLNRSIPRYMVAHILSQVIVFDNETEINQTVSTQILDFYDAGNYANSVARLYQTGIVQGYPDGTFKPNNLLKRAECSAIIFNYSELPEDEQRIRRKKRYVPPIDNRTLEEIQEEVNNAVAAGMTTVTISSNITLDNGSSAAHLAINNAAGNKNNQIVTILNNSDDTVIYKSPVIKVGESIDEDVLAVQLKKGQYDCKAIFSNVNADEEIISEVYVNVKITVNN